MYDRAGKLCVEIFCEKRAAQLDHLLGVEVSLPHEPRATASSSMTSGGDRGSMRSFAQDYFARDVLPESCAAVTSATGQRYGTVTPDAKKPPGEERPEVVSGMNA